MANISRYKTRFPLSLFSDEPKWGLRYCEPPGQRNIKVPNYISNLVFLWGLQYAIQKQIDLLVWIEPDCRVSEDFWDERMLTEALKKSPHFVCAGSPVCFHPSQSGHSVLKRTIKYAADYLSASGMGMPIFGFKGHLSLYPNGAGAIYKTEIIAKMFGNWQTDLRRAALMQGTWALSWDYQIGHSMFEMFGESVFDLVVPLTCSYSGNTDELTNEHERLEMLASGRKILVHQVKSNIV